MSAACPTSTGQREALLGWGARNYVQLRLERRSAQVMVDEGGHAGDSIWDIRVVPGKDSVPPYARARHPNL